jgi:hypothetical protein
MSGGPHPEVSCGYKLPQFRKRMYAAIRVSESGFT